MRDDGPGCAGNKRIAKLKMDGIQETFVAQLLEEHGRGIPLMMTFMDRVIYNKDGNEVMLVKNIEVERGLAAKSMLTC